MSPVPVVTIDGPSGTGKGTLSAWLAARLGWHFLDSGALYRLVGLMARRAGVDLGAEPEVAALARALPIRFEVTGGEFRPLLQGEDVADDLRTETAGADASLVAALPEVRIALLERQRHFRQPPGLVADGRDMGTVVFPDAGLKIFLTASADERARRRHKQLSDKGNDVKFSVLLEDIRRRDQRDSERAVAPLVPAPDAVILDTTGLGITQVEEKVDAMLRQRGWC